MNAALKWLEKDRSIYIVLSLLFLAFCVFNFRSMPWLTSSGWPRIVTLVPIFAAAFAGALILRQRWAHWAGIAMFASSILAIFQRAAISGRMSLMSIGSLACLCYGIYQIWNLPEAMRREEEEEEEEESPEEGDDESSELLSLVFLLREPQFLDATILANIASRAWGMPVATGDGDSDDERRGDESETDSGGAFIVGDAPLFIVKHPQAMLLIHVFDRPYFEDAEKVLDDIIEFRCRTAVAQHQAWLSMDVVAWFGSEDRLTGAYRLIARTLAELADDNVLAVVDPAAGSIFPYDPELEAKLQSENPLAQLRDWYYSPVVCVKDDDPAMQAATAEAQRRWPEFAEQFAERAADAQACLIKAAFGKEGHREFMWVEVTGIENGVVYGILQNDPVDVPGLKCGDKLHCPAGQVCDWIYLRDQAMVGGFTLKIISDRAREPGSDT